MRNALLTQIGYEGTGAKKKQRNSSRRRPRKRKSLKTIIFSNMNEENKEKIIQKVKDRYIQNICGEGLEEMIQKIEAEN